MGARGWCSVAVSRASASPVWPLSSQSWRIPIRKTLAVADAELVDGLQVSVWGPPISTPATAGCACWPSASTLAPTWERLCWRACRFRMNLASGAP